MQTATANVVVVCYFVSLMLLFSVNILGIIV